MLSRDGCYGACRFRFVSDGQYNERLHVARSSILRDSDGDVSPALFSESCHRLSSISPTIAFIYQYLGTPSRSNTFLHILHARYATATRRARGSCRCDDDADDDEGNLLLEARHTTVHSERSRANEKKALSGSNQEGQKSDDDTHEQIQS
jgi:hypothetical protein